MDMQIHTDDDFIIIKNGLISDIEIIKHKQTGFYNITKTATCAAKVMRDKYNIELSKRARQWFSNNTTKDLKNICRDITGLDEVCYVLKKNTPTLYAGSYVHELLYDHFLMWLTPVYAMHVSMLLKKYHMETIEVSTTQRKICSTPECNILIDLIEYDDKCFDCLYTNRTHEIMISNHKVKEDIIMDSLSSAIGNGCIVRDQTILGTNCKRRPDGLIQCIDKNHNIIIEIDEHQHKHSGYINDDNRTYELYEALGRIPLTMIRFNPDQFNNLNNGLFNKCYETGKVSIANNDRYHHSINKLVNVVRKTMELTPNDSDIITEIKIRFDHMT